MAISIQLPDDVDVRLQNLAALTGRSKAYFVAKAVLENLDDLEDLYLVEHELESLRDGIPFVRPPEMRKLYETAACP